MRIFPWLMIGLTLVFSEPGWPRRLFALRLRHSTIRIPSFLCSRESTTSLQHEALDSGFRRNDEVRSRNDKTGRSWRAQALLIALMLFAVVQLALPLRHYAYLGNVRWNEEGYLFAWRVMLTEKVGYVRYRVREPATGQSWLVEPDEYLTPLQVDRMSFQPDMIRQTAHIIATDFSERGYTDVVVNADAFVAFNGRLIPG